MQTVFRFRNLCAPLQNTPTFNSTPKSKESRALIAKRGKNRVLRPPAHRVNMTHASISTNISLHIKKDLDKGKKNINILGHRCFFSRFLFYRV